MLKRRTLALTGAIAALLIVPAGALAAGTTVTVRVEGAKRTLLAPTAVHTHAGSITRFGAPKGSCPATDAVGALQLATHGRWGGKYSSSLGLELISLFGEKYPFTSSHYWGFWINNKYAGAGICAQTLKKGDRLLFAPAPIKGSVFPTAMQAPRTVTGTRSFKIRVVYYTAAGRAKPLANARVSDGKSTTVTSSTGYVTVRAQGAGTYHFTASEKGYVRPVPVTVKVN
jgi:hypothetical protein